MFIKYIIYICLTYFMWEDLYSYDSRIFSDEIQSLCYYETPC